jgi:ABC-type microcin C transport system duplicated ATPase subunit YejF
MLALNKTKRSQMMTTLQKPNGSLTSDLNETVKTMTEYLIPKDEQTDNKVYHERIGAQLKEPTLKADDRDCTPVEVKNAINDLK